MDLLFDLGNTRMKIAYGDDTGVHALAAIAWDAPDFLAQWHALSIALPQRIGIANVTRSHRLDALRELLVTRFPGVPVGVAESRACCGRLQVAYASPGHLGVDRFLALLAASAVAAPQLIVGAGTALTIDAIDANGLHHGGLIMPGVSLMREAITTRAPGVRWSTEAFSTDFADDTASALESGVWCALAGAVERSAQRWVLRDGHAASVVLHGGDAAMLSTQLAIPTRRDALIVMRGLVAYLDDAARTEARVSDASVTDTSMTDVPVTRSPATSA